MSAYIFSTTNPEGTKVILDTNTFNKHIILGHPEMFGNVDAIRTTIETPDLMLKSVKNENRTIYVSQNPLSSYPKLYLKAVVDHTNPYIGYVITSFFDRKLDKTKEGIVIYEKN